MNITPKQLFLIDSLGALLSTFLLGVILVQFESTFGMPREVLYPLAAIAGVFFIYSISNYLWMRENWQPYLKTIAFANLTYCLVTAVLVVYFFEKLTMLGVTYFFLEIVVIIILVFIELKAASKKTI